MSDELRINPEVLDLAKEIFGTLAEQRAEHSFSFMLSDEGADAITEALTITEWGIGANKSKLKATAQEILGDMAEVPSGSPVNINLTEYELKSMEEVVAAIDKAMESHQDGLLE